MNRAKFEAELQREGYEVTEAKIEPNEHRPSHRHPFDVRLLVLDGAITITFGTEQGGYGPGDTCCVPAGTEHEEHIGAKGVRYVIGRRSVSGAESL